MLIPAERIEGWDKRLYEVIEDARGRPFKLGEHDCFTFACQSVEAMTGENPWYHFAGYVEDRDVARIISQYGSIEDAADTIFGVHNRVPIKVAHRGDVCLYHAPKGEKAFGICLGTKAAYLTDVGLVFVPTLDCILAWRIG